MKIYEWDILSDEEREDRLSRPDTLTSDDIINNVKEILGNVKANGDQAVRDYTLRFDGVDLENISVPRSDWEAAWNGLSDRDQKVLQTAKSNIEAFHAAQKPGTISVETMPGVLCQRVPRALSSAGLYVPGGTAPLVSTLLMLAIPAKIAGVRTRVVATPPSKTGQIDPFVLAAAFLCDVTHVVACGGAQAIGALAYGTKSVPKCDKIFGPGNAYVATAKSLVTQDLGGPATDLPAGPSEAMVLADANANPTFVASDLLSQAEHDTMAQVLCVATSMDQAKNIQAEVQAQVAALPRREIAEKSLGYGRIFVCNQRDDVIDIVNTYAPEHLIIQMDAAEDYVSDIYNTGSIFLGPWTPESVGDYASGTNHTLPTGGAARAYSGVTLESFFKYMSVQSLTEQGFRNLAPVVERMADMESLEAHRRAITLRMETLS